MRRLRRDRIWLWRSLSYGRRQPLRGRADYHLLSTARAESASQSTLRRTAPAT